MKKIEIKAADGYALSALYTTPVGASCGSIILSSATGIRKEFYIHFTRYLVQNGYTVLLFDYRGAEGMGTTDPKAADAIMYDWGMLDMNAVLNYMVYERGQKEIIWIGHSIGAQLTGFLRNTHFVKKVIAVNAAVGYREFLPFFRRIMTWTFCYLFSPFRFAIYGYGSLKKEDFGKYLPRKVLLEWRQWCKSKNYYQQFLAEHFNMDKFYSFKTPVISVYTSDDYMANEKTARLMLSFFPNAPSRLIKLQVERYTAHKVGHAGIFSKKFHRDLWAELIEIIEFS